MSPQYIPLKWKNKIYRGLKMQEIRETWKAQNSNDNTT